MKLKTKASAMPLAKSERLSGFLMIISLALALIMANTSSLSQQYVKLVLSTISLGKGQLVYHTTLISLVNDGLMTLFFLLIGLELKHHFVLGEYQNRRSLVLPTSAAIGGVIIPALVYTYFNFGEPTAKGWAVPVASDTAFMLVILSFFSRHVSIELRAFIISFSLIDDALALAVLAIFYTKSHSIVALVASLIIFISLIGLNKLKAKNSLYYLGIGTLLWIAIVKAGIHGALCGAILALTIPVKIGEEINPSFQKLENMLKPLVHYCILPLFVFINSGINLGNLIVLSECMNLSLGIILGLFLGKQAGIFGFSYLIIKYSWGKLPSGTTWTKFYAISILGGVGFTLSLFIGGITFEEGCSYYSMRSAVIIGSTLSAIFGTLLFAYSTK